MQHFANFIRLTDKNINSARDILNSNHTSANNAKDSFTRLSGFNPQKTASTRLEYHDNIQHGMVTKDLYRAATGQNPNQYFRKNSLQEQSKVMPLVQNRQIPAQEKNTANNRLENTVKAIANPENISEKYTSPLNYPAINAYTRKKYGDGQRLAGRTTGRTLVENNAFDPSKYYPNEKDNQAFKNNYIKEAKENDKLKSSIEDQFSSYLNLDQPPKANTGVGDRLRDKLKTREAYSKQFDNLNGHQRDVALKLYGQTGLMPR